MKLRTLLTLLMTGVLGLAALSFAAVFQIALQDYSSATAIRAVETRTQAVAAFLGRNLFEEWQRIDSAATEISEIEDEAELEAAIDALGQGGGKVSWLGLADRSGTVVASTRGLLVGESVAQRPWFQEGLQGPFAGDVHEAVLLARLLQSESAEPLRFVDFSAPVLDDSGRVAGVLGSHVNWSWVRDIAAEAAAVLDLDLFIINRAGTIVLATAPAGENLGTLASFRAVQLGRETTAYETWPDGETYFTASISNLEYQNLPSFGWSLVTRLDPQLISGAESEFRRTMLIAAIAILAFAIAAFALLTAVLLRPLQPLSQTLLDLARGEHTGFVREFRRFREARILSDTLALLQSRRGSGRD